MNLYNANTHLYQLVQAALDDEEVFIARAGKPAVMLVSIIREGERTLGWVTLQIDPATLHAAFMPEVDKQVAVLFASGKS